MIIEIYEKSVGVPFAIFECDNFSILDDNETAEENCNFYSEQIDQGCKIKGRRLVIYTTTGCYLRTIYGPEE